MFRSLVTALVFLCMNSVPAAADDPVYRAEGDKVELSPGPVVQTITSITWKQGPDIVMEWTPKYNEAYRHFKDRGRLNHSTGTLTITGLTRGDSGNYTAEINNEIAGKTELLVISCVPKPTVSTSCNPERTSCVFTCETNTTDTDLITYSWMSGDKALNKTQNITITKEEAESEFNFTFELKNPLSSKSSNSVNGPFVAGSGLHTALIYGVILLVAVFVGVFIYMKRRRTNDPLLSHQASASTEIVNETEAPVLMKKLSGSVETTFHDTDTGGSNQNQIPDESPKLVNQTPTVPVSTGNNSEGEAPVLTKQLSRSRDVPLNFSKTEEAAGSNQNQTSDGSEHEDEVDQRPAVPVSTGNSSEGQTLETSSQEPKSDAFTAATEDDDEAAAVTSDDQEAANRNPQSDNEAPDSPNKDRN